MTLATGTTIALGTTACRCGHPPLCRVGEFDGSNFIVTCPGCGKPRARISQSTAHTIGSIASVVSAIWGAPAELITLRPPKPQLKWEKKP